MITILAQIFKVIKCFFIVICISYYFLIFRAANINKLSTCRQCITEKRFVVVVCDVLMLRL